jgi:hypothetical protein
MENTRTTKDNPFNFITQLEEEYSKTKRMLEEQHIKEEEEAARETLATQIKAETSDEFFNMRQRLMNLKQNVIPPINRHARSHAIIPKISNSIPVTQSSLSQIVRPETKPEVAKRQVEKGRRFSSSFSRFRKEKEPSVTKPVDLDISFDLTPDLIAKAYQTSVDDIREAKIAKTENDKVQVSGALAELKKARIRLQKAEEALQKSELYQKTLLHTIVEKYNKVLNEKIDLFNNKLTTFAKILSSIIAKFKTFSVELMKPIYTISPLVGHPYDTQSVDSIPDTLFYYIKHCVAIEHYISAMISLDGKLDTLFKENIENTREYAQKNILGINQEITTIYEQLKMKINQINVHISNNGKDYIQTIVKELNKQITLLNLEHFTTSKMEHWNKNTSQRFMKDDPEDEKQVMHQLLQNVPPGKEQGVFRIIAFLSEMIRVGRGPSVERSTRVTTRPKAPMPRSQAPPRDTMRSKALTPRARQSSGLMPPPPPTDRFTEDLNAKAKQAETVVAEEAQTAIVPISQRQRLRVTPSANPNLDTFSPLFFGRPGTPLRLPIELYKRGSSLNRQADTSLNT